jgi:hypothetical protein
MVRLSKQVKAQIGEVVTPHHRLKATSDAVLRQIKRVAEAYRCDAYLQKEVVIFTRPASSVDNKLVNLAFHVLPTGIEMEGRHELVPKHIVRMVLALLDDTFTGGLTPRTRAILEGLQNG